MKQKRAQKSAQRRQDEAAARGPLSMGERRAQLAAAQVQAALKTNINRVSGIYAPSRTNEGFAIVVGEL